MNQFKIDFCLKEQICIKYHQDTIKLVMKGFCPKQCKEFVEKVFEESVIPSLSDFIAIPNLSRAYDSEWATNGLLEQAANHIKGWVEEQEIKGLKSQIIKDQGYTPIIFTEISGDIPDRTIMFYGHFDKQPPMVGWDEDKGPNKPVIIDGKLYGRGGADDGYSTYSSMVAVKTCQLQGIPLPRIVMITQGDEESGNHIDYYMVKLKERIGTPQVIFCLDSGALDYEYMWKTNSLRGYIEGLLKVKILTEGVHSGDASGVVPSAFRIAKMLLGRLEDVETGAIHREFTVDIPPNRYQESFDLVKQLGEQAIKDYPWYGSTKPISQNTLSLVINRTWLPQLTVTGVSGMPAAETAGNVMLPECGFKFSLRCPPTLNVETKSQFLKELLTSNPPYGAEVTLQGLQIGSGWNCPEYSPWLDEALKSAATQYFGKQLKGQGEGASIPLMGLLSELWPKAQFIVAGVLGPNSNAHGPNQFLHIPYCKKLTQAMAHVLASSSNV